MSSLKFKFLFVLFLLFSFSPLYCQDFEIDKKTLRAIKVMETRHFQNNHENEDILYRVQALEEHLFGQGFQDYTLKKRIDRLKIASQQKMLQGAAIPLGTGISRKQMRNNKITIKQSDDVGIIDGLMKLYTPDLYEFYKRKNERHLEYEN